MNWLDQFLAAHPSVMALLSLGSVIAVLWSNKRRQEPIIVNSVGRVDAPNSDLGFDPSDISAEEGKPEFVRLRDLALSWGWTPGDAGRLAAEVLRGKQTGNQEADLRRVISSRLQGRDH
jgi:hypothetical protein